VEFGIAALGEALARFGQPEILNADSKNESVGSFSAVMSHQATNCPRVSTQRGVPVALTRTPIDRVLCLSLDLSGG
jgi:hypothetical protein